MSVPAPRTPSAADGQRRHRVASALFALALFLPSIGFAQLGAQLFSFGAAAGDAALERNDDGFESVSLAGAGPAGTSLTIPFYGSNQSSFFVNNNGLVSFGSGVSTYVPTGFPIDTTNLGLPAGTALIAPFWADVDTRNPASGQVWYRTVQDTAALATFGNLVHNAILGQSTFTPTFAEVVTWDHVGYYNQQVDKLNTFQLAVVSNGVRTFAFFLYPQGGINWLYGSASQGVYPSVGFDSGDGTHYYNALGSLTADVANLPNLTTTVPPQPGVQVFQINNATPNPNGDAAPGATVFSGPAATVDITSTFAETVQLGASGYVFNGGAGSVLQFQHLTFASATDIVSFTGSLAVLTYDTDAVTQGTLNFGDSTILVARGTSAIDGGTINLRSSAQLQLYSEAATTSATTLTFDTTTAGGTGGTLDLRGYNTTLGAIASIGPGAGVITNSGSAASTLTIDAATASTFSGTMQNGTGPLALTKSGAGTLTLAGTNTYTGATTVSAGALQFATTAALYNSATADWTDANLIVNSGATAAFNVGGSGEFSSADLDSLKALGTASGGFKSGSQLGLDTTNATGGLFTYASDIANPNSGANALGLVKLGAGTLVLSGANTFTGGVTIDAGTLGLASDSALGTGPLTINGGEIRAVNAGRTITNATTLNGSFNLGRLTSLDGPITLASNLTITSTNPDGQSLAASILGGTISGGFSLSFAEGANPIGTIILSGTNNYTGGTAFNGGRVAVSTDRNLGATSGSVSFDGGSLNATGSFSAARATTLHAGGGTLETDDGVTLAWSGAITGVGALTKYGLGSLVLAGASDYAGGTTIEAGVLIAAHPSALGTGAVSVGGATSVLALSSTTIANAVSLTNGGTLSGSGGVGALTIGSGGILSPGNSPGTMNAGDTTWSPGGTYEWQINDANGIAGTNWDFLNITGSLDLTGLANADGSRFTLALVSLTGENAAGLLANFDPSQNYTYTVATATAGILGFDGDALSIDRAAFANSAPGTWSLGLGNDSHDLNLSYTATAIPEPATYALLAGLGLFGFAVWRRRRLQTRATW